VSAKVCNKYHIEIPTQQENITTVFDWYTC